MSRPIRRQTRSIPLASFARIASFALAILMPVGAHAGDEKALSGSEISDVLSAQVVEGTGPQEPWRQIFYADGRTIYRDKNQGRDSRGEWQVKDDQFCSLWPPARDWDCYRMTGSGEAITFVPLDGSAPWPAMITGDSLL